MVEERLFNVSTGMMLHAMSLETKKRRMESNFRVRKCYTGLNPPLIFNISISGVVEVSMLQIRLLGQFDVRLDGKRVLIPSRPGQSLLAYFALSAGTAHRREKLAGTFWPDTSEEIARKNLRQELWRIRKAISGNDLEGSNYLLAEEFTIAFNPHADYWLDVSHFEKPGLDIESLTSSLALYKGELLPGFYEEWILLERERIRSRFDNKMEQLLARLIAAERWTAVQEQAERWLAMGSCMEPAYRALMLVYGARGDMAKVSHVYQQCMAALDEQLGLEPSAETRALYDGLLKGSQLSTRSMGVQTSGTVTFLFTDIEQSTKLLDQLGDQYAAVLADHHRILRTSIAKWNGQEVDTQGDAFFVTFARCMDAVQCAAEAQRALAAHPWPNNQPLRVRMGLHTGEPLIATTGYVGMDVHRAARIGDAANGGQVLLSQSTRELILYDLPKGLSLRDLGEHRLKDMKYPASLYQLVIEGLPQDFPRLRTKFTGTEAPTAGVPPFKGLQYFEEADSELFYGRELLTAKLVERLKATRFLSVVIGASGSGKSSLVRAGLVPALRKGEPLLDGVRPPDGSETWQVHVLTPTARPLEALALELTRGAESVTAAAALMDDLMQDSRSLSLFLARIHSRQHMLLVLDQFEELFTLCRDEFEREAFIDNLLTLIQQSDGRYTVIITLRADFYAHLAQYPELRDAVAQHQEYIGPMSVEELRRAIEEPARRAHWEFEPGLVDLILRDVGDEPGALPLLSHALLETWKRRAGHTLTLKGYADAGGVHGAIAHTAETLYQGLSADEQEMARDIFLRLTELGEGTEDTRRRATFEELFSHTDEPEEVRAVLNALADARLVTLSEETVEVAHEALIREWPTLREWLNQDREGLRLHRHLTEAAYEWELLGHDTGALYRGAHLAQAREWVALHPRALNAKESTFLNASLEHAQHEQREREEGQQRELEAARRLAEAEKTRAEEQAHSANRLRIRNRVITAVGLLALLLAVVALVFGAQSNANALKAQTNLGIADQQRATAVGAQATAESNFRQAEARRLAAEASKLLASQGSPELIALLSLRSMDMEYTPEGDSALSAAARLDYPVQIFTLPGSTVNGLAFSPDGKYILAGTGDSSTGRAVLLDARSGQKIRDFTGPGGSITALAYSRDGKYMLSGASDGTALLWEVGTGKWIRLLIGHRKPISSVALSPDGKYVLTGSLDGTARVWDLTTGRELYQIASHADSVKSTAISPDGRYGLLGNSSGMAELWDIQTGEVVRQFLGHTISLNAVTFSPDGNRILTGGYDGIARLWDVETGGELQEFTGHILNIGSVAFSQDGGTIFTGSDDGTVRKWDTKSGRELQRYTGSNGMWVTAPQLIAISPDGQYLINGNSYSLNGNSQGEIRLWDLEQAPRLPVFKNPSNVNGLAFSPDGRLALTTDSTGTIHMWEVRSGKEVRDFKGHADLINYGVAFSPDGKYVLSGSWDRTVRLWDAGTGRELRQFSGPAAPVESVAFSPDGRQVLAAADEGMWLWETKTGSLVREWRDLKQVVRLAFSPDGRYIATTGMDGAARILDVSTGKVIHQYSLDGSPLYGISFSPDGKSIAVGSAKGAVRLCDSQACWYRPVFSGHTADVMAAEFSPDGKYLATASLDGTARVWDALTGRELRRLIGHADGVENVVFSPDGKYLLTASDDSTAMLWDVDYHTTMQSLCVVLLRDFTPEERLKYDIESAGPTCAKP
jgi:WD40 repeat protein/DNA-binding SARP family transcriptional activator